MKFLSLFLLVATLSGCGMFQTRQNFNIDAVDEDMIVYCMEQRAKNPTYSCSLGDQDKEVFYCGPKE